MQRATILLTGATGFLGSNLLARFVEHGYAVVALKRPTSNLSRIREWLNRIRIYDVGRDVIFSILKENQVDAIVHCATNYGRGTTLPLEIIEANLILPLQLLELAEQHGVHAFLNSDTILDKRISQYSLSKKHFLDWLSLFSRSLTCVNVALEHFYGPFDDRSKFVTKILLDLLREVEEIPLTPGRQRRDFIYIDDVVNAFIHILDFSLRMSKGFYCFEVGTGRAMEIQEFVKLAKELVGNCRTRLSFGALPYREHEVMDSKVNADSLVNLGWQAPISVREGLLRMIAQERSRLPVA